MKTWIIAASVMAVVSLTGCKTTEDPAKGGFFSGLSNMADGTYDRRQQVRREEVENQQDTKLQKQRELERTNAQRDAIAAERAQVEKRYAALDADLKALETKLANAKMQQSDLQRQVDALQARIDMLKSDTFTPDAEKAKRLDALKKEKSDLENQIDMAIGKR